MKHILILTLMLSTQLGFSQKFNWKQPACATIFGLVSGGSWGLNQRLNHHYENFSSQYPKANAQFWNPAISWTNKYNQNNPELGRNHKIIWFTDAHHLTNSVSQVSGVCGGITIGIGSHKKWWKYLIDAGCFSAGYVIGNSIMYR